jgi:putative heme-binding domain-containing protein
MTLDRTLADPDHEVRLVTLQRMEQEKIPIRSETLIRWLRNEQKSDSVAAILSSLKGPPSEKVRDAVEAVVREHTQSITNRLAALEILVRGLDGSSEGRLLDLAASIEESAVLAETLRQIGRRQGLNSTALLLRKLRAATADVRVAAIDALAALGTREGRLHSEGFAQVQTSLIELLDDAEASVRAAAAAAMGKLQMRESVERLIARAEDSNPLVRRRSLEALTQLREPRAVKPALQALERDDQEVFAAMKCLAEVGSPADGGAITAAAIRSRSSEVLQLATQLLLKWDLAAELARIQGASGVMLGWRVSEPLSKEEAARTVESIIQRSSIVPRSWRVAATTNVDSRVTFGSANDDAVRIGVSEFAVPQAVHAEFRLSSSGTLDVWLNGNLVYRRSQAGKYATDSDRFQVDLEPGLNRLVAQISDAAPAEMHARFRRKSATERQEHLSQLALATRGNPAHGREVFFNAEKSGCIKCHRLGDEGGRIGPDLTGVGRRFSRIHLVESILEPSRAIAPAFRNVLVRLKDGQELIGVRVAESESALTLGDAQGQSHTFKKDQIQELRTLELSIMPEGLENALTDEEFVDLIAFLAEQK